MATQGIVSVRENGQVVFKVIAGCDGYNAVKLARRIEEENLRDIDAIYSAALDVDFGESCCLVVMDQVRARYDDEPDALLPLYRKTFSNPRFNPRWESGLVEDDCVAIVDR